MTRRESLRLMTGGSIAAGVFPWTSFSQSSPRDFHVCLSPKAVLDDRAFPARLRAAGISCVWLAAYFYGHWPWPLADLLAARDQVQGDGLEAHIVNIPLGHPGDSLGSKNGSFPLTPPPHWRLAETFDAKAFAGTSLHQPATEENTVALGQLRAAKFSRIFLDDDFRLARGPGNIGGCFCAEHQQRFLRRTGFSTARWPELLDDARSRRLTPLLHEWVEFTCDELTASFRAQQRVAGAGLGIMVMYLGAEKAGIRLGDYRGVPCRVGELMFSDAGFDPLKGKTDELFSVLFHRRFLAPENAYSESTAYPSDQLSAANLSAKLVISTFADVRHTMFMSGITPFPMAHWAALAPKMKRQADFHRALAGHKLRGPFKHYWGVASRYAGDDRPFSLFLASGIPFEVTDEPARDGWTFLSEADAKTAASGKFHSPGTTFVQRPPALHQVGTELCEESLEALFAYKRRLDPRIPFVENPEPAILGWYPSAHAALLWNPTAARKTFSVRHRRGTRTLTLDALDAELLRDFD